jgi:hypothetical protein
MIAVWLLLAEFKSSIVTLLAQREVTVTDNDIEISKNVIAKKNTSTGRHFSGIFRHIWHI